MLTSESSQVYRIERWYAIGDSDRNHTYIRWVDFYKHANPLDLNYHILLNNNINYMSAILGIINLKGKNVESQELEKMKISIAQWGPEASGNWIKRNVGLGQLLSYNTPEARYEKLPFTDVSDRYVIVSRARIDNPG